MKLKQLIEKRKALLDKIDANLAAVEKREEGKRVETPEEVTQRQADMAEIKQLDDQIKFQTELAEQRRAQQELEQRSAPAGARTVPATHEVQGALSEREQRDLQKYSLVRAFNALLEGRPLDGIEGEMSQHAQNEMRSANVPRGTGNFFVPQVVLARSGVVGSFETRDLTATGGASGSEGGVTIPTMLGSIIDRLRKKLVLNQLGVTTLGGLQGNIDFPKVAADDQAVEKAENATSAESSVTFSKISLSPRRLPVFAEISRQLLLQTSTDVEAWVRNDLAFQIAQVMDSRGINGSGSGQPYGILNTVGVGSYAMGTNGADLDWNVVVGLETLIAQIDADVGRLGYLTNTKVRGKAKRTQIFSGTSGEPIWSRFNPNTPLNEYSVGVSNNVPSNLVKGTSGAVCSALAFGNFADAIMAQWGGLEFLVNPYSKDTEGIVRINCWTFYDFLVRRAESFAVSKDILTT